MKWPTFRGQQTFREVLGQQHLQQPLVRVRKQSQGRRNLMAILFLTQLDRELFNSLSHKESGAVHAQHTQGFISAQEIRSERLNLQEKRLGCAFDNDQRKGAAIRDIQSASLPRMKESQGELGQKAVSTRHGCVYRTHVVLPAHFHEHCLPTHARSIRASWLYLYRGEV